MDEGIFEESYKPTNKEETENITNLDFLSRMLHKDLRSYINSYNKYLSAKLSKDLLSLFMDLSEKLGEGDVSPEVLNAILPDLGITDVRRDIIVRNYKLISEDSTKVLKKSTYERFRELVYRSYFETVNTGSAVETLEKIQSGEFFLPPFGVMESDNFKQVDFGALDMNSIVEELGAPLYSHFPEINELFPIKGYIPSQVTMVSGPPACFTGDTKIMTLDHKFKTFLDLYNSKEKDIPVYSVDDYGNIKVSKAECVSLTKYVNELAEVSVNGKTFRCTVDHKFKLVTGEWKEARDLKPGDSLMPIHRTVQPNRQSLIRGKNGHQDSGYEACYTVVDKGKDNYYTHRLAKEYLDPENVTKYVHHNKRKEDDSGFDSLNNEFKNLILCKSRSEHWKIHCQYPEARKQVLEAGFKTRLTSERMHSFSKEMWKQHYEKYREVCTKNILKSVPKTIARNSGEKSEQKKLGVLKFVNGLIKEKIITKPEDLTCDLYQSERYKFVLSNKRTPSFWSAMKYFNGSVKEVYEEALKYKNHTVDSVKIISLTEPEPVFDLINVDLYHNFAIYWGEDSEKVDSGFIVSNSGKTLFMMTEAVEAIKQHKKVMYVAIGDLKPFDFVSRICSMLMKTPMTKTALSINSVFESVIRICPEIKENLTIQFISPDKYTPNQWLKLNEQLGNIENYDVFFLDYDTNFASNKDSMYAKGDEVYTMAYTLSQYPGKYVFIGSQPKIGNWRDSALGMETASESSRKQQIIDVMITISHDRDVRNSKNHIGTINVPKNRRGGMTKFKYILDPTGIMESITDEAYTIFKDEDNVISVIESPDSDLDTKFVQIDRSKKITVTPKVTETGEIVGLQDNVPEKKEEPKERNVFEDL